jgi:uncharacterized protein YigE (DUF2233 family)
MGSAPRAGFRPHRLARVAGLMLFAGLIGGASATASGGRKPELAAEPEIALLYAAGKAARSSAPLPGVTYRVIELTDFGLKVRVWGFAKDRYRLRVAEQKETHGSRVGELLGPKDTLAINAGFFERDKQKVLAPSGLVIVDGKELAPEHPRAGSGIVYATTEGVAISYRRDLADRTRMKYAVQVGPVLVDPGGKVGVADKQHDRQNRSAVCLGGDALVIVVVEGGLSLFQLASLLASPAADGGVGCDVALNLDGGPSTQAVFRAGGKEITVEGGWPVANALIVSPAAP